MVLRFLQKMSASRLIILLCYDEFARKKYWIYLQISCTITGKAPVSLQCNLSGKRQKLVAQGYPQSRDAFNICQESVIKLQSDDKAEKSQACF
ncbi:hypothetical protein LH22_16370 [Pantoea rwandensis]|uniref:Uncharacterized protein n=1 Tax=Pantoea rwandensis TaxID=1076550 RepID=A0ABM5RM88_9GAMM|nr:hypothetical protein LH22_16370 [Pantoea rwandensis]KGT93783.1 hypothetical protein NH00_02370 [Enterobacter cancerogenus]KJV26747.1 hypothetical protein VI01_20490 [Pantoea sp. SM3]HAU5564209.1 hypothetical protein [Serratia fonticola]